jgi:hypothetical protein
MKIKAFGVLVIAIAAYAIAGCGSSESGKIEPLTSLGKPSASKTGPHPMPGNPTAPK